MNTVIATLLSVLAFATTVLGQHTSTTIDDARHVPSSSREFSSSKNPSVAYFRKQGLGDELVMPALGAMSQNDFARRVAAIRRETPMSGVSVGVRGLQYDVILQAGHYGRSRGVVGTSGRLVSERALNSYIVDRIAQKLRADGISVLLISADQYLRKTPGATTFDGLRSKAFLSVHSDGSPTVCSTGPSLAYKRLSSPFAMHAIGYALSASLGYRYSDFRPDGFTANEANYYMFSQVQSPLLTGLLEIGELTCGRSERVLIENADIIASNVAKGLRFIITSEGPR